ncbi:HlyD family efflux transporter periplasmic adaptor subunit [Blautia pseudococcoides]|uniref:HlyD family efflux transporter periplasmic adaptor subunit n=1 Tax=Blautia pseudococcoides TaxID=1796616 RepID=UPI000A472415|nr:HlyD family efflux transporter periplasmic adaptor subunit [Blautia pseudococcoides]
MTFIKKLLSIIKKIFTFNIATLLFGALFIYMLITVLLYITSTHVTSYQVTAGPLSRNPVCTALAVRDEEVVTADSPGYIRYYAREGMKVRKGGNVYALSDTKNVKSDITLSKDQLEQVRTRIADFSNNFSGTDFYDAYSFKYEMQGLIFQQASSQGTAPADAVEDQDEEDSDVTVIRGSMTFGNQVVHTSPSAGLVIYSTDGYEGKTVEDLTEEDFNQKAYEKNDLLTDGQAKAGDAVYKLVKDDNWTLMVPLSDKLAAKLADRKSIKVKFLKDGETQTGQLSLMNVGNQKVAKITLKNGMVRYASDRFLKIELVINTQSGLKIPMRSIVTKEFYIIPSSFLTKGGNENSAGFLRETATKGGDKTTEFVSATIYKNTAEENQDGEVSEDTENTAAQDGYCYVDKQTFQDGDVLHKPETQETFVVGEIDYLEGVYSMNKGYAVFRQIDIIDQNEEYCIVKPNTSYGLEAFDRIVDDGESVKEEDILTGK